jgi:hypothetical protein
MVVVGITSLVMNIQRLLGETKETVTISLPKAYSNIHYRCADPLCMPAELEGFDIAIISDIIDQLPSPNGLLARLGTNAMVMRCDRFMCCSCM